MRDLKDVDFSLWEKRYGRSLSEEERREIVTNLGGFFRILIQSDLSEKKQKHQKEIQDLEKTARVYGVEI